MRVKRISIYHILVVLLIFSIVLPTNATNAQVLEEGSLTIHKYEQEPGSPKGKPDGKELDNPPIGGPLPGVTYKVKQTHSYSNGKWTPIENGAEYDLTTGQNGKVTQNLPLGRYTVKETDGPDHVILNPKTFKVDIPMTNKDGSGPLNYHVHIYPKNETIRGAVELYKIDGANQEPLPGVQFDLYDQKGKINDDPLVTDGEGKIKVDNLAFGNYYFKEIKTLEGYMLGDQNVEFSINANAHNDVVHLTVDNYKEPEVDKEVDRDAVNRGETVEYTITVELPADIQSYKYFDVTDMLHENLEFLAVTEQPAGFTFEENGQELKWVGTPSELEQGTVTFKFTAKVKEDAEANKVINNKAYIDYENRHGYKGEKETIDVPVTPTVGNIVVIKKDGNTNEYLQGAKFELRQNGEVVKSGTTNSDGILDFGEVDFGDYELVEVKAPNGYSLIPDAETIKIDSAETKEVTVKNYKSDWELPKTGGIGTMLFTIVGLSFMGTALYMMRRRRKEDTV